MKAEQISKPLLQLFAGCWPEEYKLVLKYQNILQTYQNAVFNQVEKLNEHREKLKTFYI